MPGSCSDHGTGNSGSLGERPRENAELEGVQTSWEDVSGICPPEELVHEGKIWTHLIRVLQRFYSKGKDWLVPGRGLLSKGCPLGSCPGWSHLSKWFTG